MRRVQSAKSHTPRNGILSEKASIHRTYVSSIELGKVDVGLNVARRLADALGKPLSQLVREADKSLTRIKMDHSPPEPY